MDHVKAGIAGTFAQDCVGVGAVIAEPPAPWTISAIAPMLTSKDPGIGISKHQSRQCVLARVLRDTPPSGNLDDFCFYHAAWRVGAVGRVGDRMVCRGITRPCGEDDFQAGEFPMGCHRHKLTASMPYFAKSFQPVNQLRALGILPAPAMQPGKARSLLTSSDFGINFMVHDPRG